MNALHVDARKIVTYKTKKCVFGSYPSKLLTRLPHYNFDNTNFMLV